MLLVLDATIGQNGLAQARVFADVVDTLRPMLPPDLRDQVGQQIDDLLEAGDDDAPAPIDLPL